MNGIVQRLTTQDFPVSQRLNRWVAFGSETLSELKVVPAQEDTFRATMIRAQLGDIGFVSMESNAALATGLSRRAGPWSAPSGEAYLLRVQEYGQSVIGGSGREMLLRPGEMTLRASSANWWTRIPRQSGLVTIKIPADLFRERVACPEPLLDRVFGGATGPASVALSTILALKQLANKSRGDRLDSALEELLLSAITVALTTSSNEADASPGLSERHYQIWQQACAHIDASLHDDDLTPAGVATTVGVGLRTLQRIFELMGESPREYILSRRLERAKEMLLSSGEGPRANVTEIAFSLGFADLSHFSRAFSHRFGRSPRHFLSH